MVRDSDDPDAGRAFDEFDFISIRGINENKPATGGCPRRAVRDLDSLRLERRNGFIKTIHLECQMDKIVLHGHGSARRKTGQLNQLIAVRDLEEGKLRSSRRRLPLQHLKPEHIRIKPDRSVQVTDAHAGVE